MTQHQIALGGSGGPVYPAPEDGEKAKSMLNCAFWNPAGGGPMIELEAEPADVGAVVLEAIHRLENLNDGEQDAWTFDKPSYWESKGPWEIISVSLDQEKLDDITFHQIVMGVDLDTGDRPDCKFYVGYRYQRLADDEVVKDFVTPPPPLPNAASAASAVVDALSLCPDDCKIADLQISFLPEPGTEVASWQ